MAELFPDNASGITAATTASPANAADAEGFDLLRVRAARAAIRWSGFPTVFQVATLIAFLGLAVPVSAAATLDLSTHVGWFEGVWRLGVVPLALWSALAAILRLIGARQPLGALWKVHILHHAQAGPIVGHWMIEELREHGYRVSPGTLYPLLARMEKLGWLERVKKGGHKSAKEGRPFRATAAGRRALREIEARLREMIGEVHIGKKR